jgi:putative endonuclease
MTDQLSSSIQIGRRFEERAASILCAQGCEILAQNFTSRFGEIDIIAKDGDELVFVEVRFRRSSRYGTPLETVNFRKRRKIYRTAQWYLMQLKQPWPRCRFDILSIEGQGATTFLLTKHAFDETMI